MNAKDMDCMAFKYFLKYSVTYELWDWLLVVAGRTISTKMKYITRWLPFDGNEEEGVVFNSAEWLPTAKRPIRGWSEGEGGGGGGSS